MIFIKYLLQHQGKRKHAGPYRKTGHNLGLEPNNESEKDEQRRSSPKETDLATNGNAWILQMLWGTCLWRQK